MYVCMYVRLSLSVCLCISVFVTVSLFLSCLCLVLCVVQAGWIIIVRGVCMCVIQAFHSDSLKTSTARGRGPFFVPVPRKNHYSTLSPRPQRPPLPPCSAPLSRPPAPRRTCKAAVGRERAWESACVCCVHRRARGEHTEGMGAQRRGGGGHGRVWPQCMHGRQDMRECVRDPCLGRNSAGERSMR